MWAGGWLPKFADNMYHDAEEDYWFVPTAEVALTNLHRDEILEPQTIPLNYVAYTPCFRREKMSAGRDVRGIKRVHQFDKVELYRLVEPERSEAALEALVEDAEAICRALAIPHRVLQLCSGDLGFNAAKSYDIEMWAPGCGEWLEVSSCSNCTDFQARRANIRFRRQKGRPPGASPYAQRLRPGPPPHPHRRPGELPAAGRLRDGTGGASTVHGRYRADRPVTSPSDQRTPSSKW